MGREAGIEREREGAVMEGIRERGTGIEEEGD